MFIQDMLWNDGWRFRPGGTEADRQFWKAGYTRGPAARFAQDSAWQRVTLPHDWGQELDYDFTVGIHHGAAPIGEGRVPRPVGWYRKAFDAPAQWAGACVSLHFDGVFRDCEVFVNGQYVTRHVSGYTGFTVELDDLLFYGEPNTIALRVDASRTEGWFYEGAGIYRNVHLRVLPKVHIVPDTVFLRLDRERDVLLCGFDIRNESDAACGIPFSACINGLSGPVPGSAAVPAGETVRIETEVPAAGYHAWDIGDPFLYDVTLTAGEDVRTVRTGLRRFRFDPDEGFFLNGRHVKLLGSCTHQDFAVCGAALTDDIQAYKASVLKEYGFNAIRTSHNTPADALMDACDRLGLVVMAEVRLFGSTPAGLGQLSAMITDLRNHPCVILWSVGNEEIIQGTASGGRQAKRACALAHRLDPTRPTTYGGNNGDEYDGVNAEVDVRGINYLYIQRDPARIDRYHKAHPHQPIVGSEESSCLASRESWYDEPALSHTQNFDNCGPGYMMGAEALWSAYMKRPYLAGPFIWTGIDYRGEASKQGYITNFGVIDWCGFPKSTAHYYRAAGRPEPYIYLYPDWDRRTAEGAPLPAGTETEVIVYTNADAVRLYINGTEAGFIRRAPYAAARFTVPFAPGSVTAVGLDACGNEITRCTSYTPGAPVRLCADTVRIGGTSFLRVTALDSDGHFCPRADMLLHFTPASGAVIRGAGNGDPADTDGELTKQRRFEKPLHSFRVFEAAGRQEYTEQTLMAVIGTDRPDRHHRHGARYEAENDSMAGVLDGPPRRLPVSDGLTEDCIRVDCRFWLDACELPQVKRLRVGFAHGYASLLLNGENALPDAAAFPVRRDVVAGTADAMSANGDALEFGVSGMVRPGENRLCLTLKQDTFFRCAVGCGMTLLGDPVPVTEKRLWNGRALCIAEGCGTVTVSADGAAPVTVTL